MKCLPNDFILVFRRKFGIARRHTDKVSLATSNYKFAAKTRMKSVEGHFVIQGITIVKNN